MDTRARQGATRKLFYDEKFYVRNEVFYLDLHGFKGAKVLEQKIIENGGRVENFFSKDVTCVITKNQQRKSPRRQNESQQTKYFKPMTRAQSILANSKQKQQKTFQTKKDIPSIAKDLGINVRYIDDFFRLLEKSENLEIRSQNEKLALRGDASKSVKAANVRKLRSPFIKVEDQSRKFKPLLQEMQDWPKIYLESSAPNCPFDSPDASTYNGKESRRNRTRSKSASTQQQMNKAENARATVNFSSNQKVGYCELCDANYRGLKQHLKGTRHRNNAANSVAFQELDETIKQGRSADEYFKSLRRRMDRSKIKSPKSPVLRTPKKTRKSSKGIPAKRCTPNKPLQQGPTVTPLKVVFTPRHGFSIVKLESPRKRKQSDFIEVKDDEVILNQTPKKRKIESYSVVQLGELKLKIRRSTRLLRGSSSDQQGSVFLDFPTYKEISANDGTTWNSSFNTSSVDQVVCSKYGNIQGKMRISTRIMDAADQKGLEEFQCPMYMEANDFQ